MLYIYNVPASYKVKLLQPTVLKQFVRSLFKRISILKSWPLNIETGKQRQSQKDCRVRAISYMISIINKV